MTREERLALTALEGLLGDRWGVKPLEMGEEKPADTVWAALVIRWGDAVAYPRFVVRRQHGDGAEAFAVDLWEGPDDPTGTFADPTIAEAAATVLALRQALRKMNTRRAFVVPTNDTVN